jgi:hypothetical protein
VYIITVSLFLNSKLLIYQVYAYETVLFLKAP